MYRSSECALIESAYFHDVERRGHLTGKGAHTVYTLFAFRAEQLKSYSKRSAR